MSYFDGNVYDYLDSEAYRVLYDYGIYSFPLDVYNLANKLNATISNITIEQMEKLKNMSLDVKINDGCVIKMQGYKYHIFLNANNSRGRIRFTIAHEIKHIIFDDNDNNEEDEKLTDYFAKILLAPPVLLQYYDCNSVEEIVRRFGVSNEVGSYLLEIKDRRRNAFGKDTIFDYEKDFYYEFIKNLENYGGDEMNNDKKKKH